MRKSLRTLLSLVGLLLVVLGSGSALWVGTDDTLAIGETQVPERAKGVAVRTHPAITDFVNIDMLVRAKADGGVFLGTSHRVDTESLLGTKRYYEITKMSLRNLGGVYTEEGGQRATRKSLRPATLVGWLDQDSDPDQAELVVPLDGEPIDIIAVPDRRSSRVTLSIGAHVAGLFWSQVAVALAGAVMIALAWLIGWWTRRRDAGGTSHRRRTDPSSETATQPTGTTPLSAPSPLPQYPSGARRTTEAPATRPHPALARATPRLTGPSYWSLRRIVMVMILVPLALVLSSCGVPGPAPAATGTETRMGMRLSEAKELYPAATDVFAQEFDAYPMWALVATERPRRLHLLTRAAFTSPWQTEAVVRSRGTLPASVPRAIAAGGTVTRRAERISTSIAQWWTGGEASAVAIDGRTRRARDELWASGVTPSSTWVTPPPPDTPPVRVVEVSRGHLVILRHTLMTPAPRRLTTVVHFPSGTGARLLGSSLVTVD